MYPVMLNLNGKKCIVIGGGGAALMKARKLKECGGDVTVISREFAEGFDFLSTVKKEYDKSDITGAFLVTAATDDKELNRQIVSDARRAHALAYAVDDMEISDFILPASARAGDITVAASTGGKYPFLAKRLRDEISRDIEFYNSILPLLEKYRKAAAGNRELLKAFVCDEMIRIAEEDTERYEEMIKNMIKERGA